MQRDYMLKNLGIVQYVPREFCIPELPETPQGDTTDKVPPLPEKERQSNAKERLVSLNTITTEPKKSLPTSTEPVHGDVGDVPLRFAMCHWLIADSLVFSALDYDQNPPQNQHQLLANILRAIGCLNSPLAEPELVQWPLVANAPGGEEEARAMFNSLLRGRIEQSNCRRVLVMGERASRFLLPKEQHSQGSYSLEGECQLVVTPGLDEMLADPDRKRDTWQLLQPLANLPDRA